MCLGLDPRFSSSYKNSGDADADAGDLHAERKGSNH